METLGGILLTEDDVVVNLKEALRMLRVTGTDSF